jgi:hypothetical protein
MARSSLLALATCAGCVLSCQGEYVRLGSSDEMLGGGAGGGGQAGSVTRVWAAPTQPLLAEEREVLLASPTLTQDGELFFSRQPRYGGQTRLWHASASTGFADASEVELGEQMKPDIASPAVSWAGNELWLGMNVNGNTDVLRSVRSADGWSAPERVPELCSDFDDAPRPPTPSGMLMPLSSKRHGQGVFYQIYLSERPSVEAAWGEPSQALLAAVNSADFQSADGFVASSGLELYFSSTRAGSSDLYVARRTSIQSAFGAPEALADLNTEWEERMPWLSPDGQALYFASNKPTPQFQQYELYVAQKL